MIGPRLRGDNRKQNVFAPLGAPAVCSCAPQLACDVLTTRQHGSFDRCRYSVRHQINSGTADHTKARQARRQPSTRPTKKRHHKQQTNNRQNKLPNAPPTPFSPHTTIMSPPPPPPTSTAGGGGGNDTFTALQHYDVLPPTLQGRQRRTPNADDNDRTTTNAERTTTTNERTNEPTNDDNERTTTKERTNEGTNERTSKSSTSSHPSSAVLQLNGAWASTDLWVL